MSDSKYQTHKIYSAPAQSDSNISKPISKHIMTKTWRHKQLLLFTQMMEGTCSNYIPDVLGGIDDFFYARHSQSDIHRRHTGKVKGFQCHLSTRLSDALSTQRPNCWAWLHLGSLQANRFQITRQLSSLYRPQYWQMIMWELKKKESRSLEKNLKPDVIFIWVLKWKKCKNLKSNFIKKCLKSQRQKPE